MAMITSLNVQDNHMDTSTGRRFGMCFGFFVDGNYDFVGFGWLRITQTLSFDTKIDGSPKE